VSAEIMGEEYRQTRDLVIEQIEAQEPASDLPDILERTSSAKIANRDFIDGLILQNPEFESELETLHEEVKDLQKQEKESFDHTKYFDDPKEVSGFQPRWLANNIEEEYSFKKVEDSEQLYVYTEGYYQPRGETVIREEVEKRLKDEYRERRVREVQSIIESRNSIKRRNFRPPKRKINVENGVYDLEKEQLLDHSPEYFFTQKIPVRYDPSSDCPNIEQFLHDIVKTEDDVKTLREIAGYLLLPDYPVPKAFMLVGKGNNGKSRYLDLLRHLVGEENLVEKGLQELEETRFGTHELAGKLGCIDDDLSSDKLQETGTMKKLTGGSRVGAEVKYGGHYNFYNFAKLVFACNELPRTADDTDGFYRRWMIVEFPYKFKDNPNPDNELEKKGRPKKELMEEITQKEELEGLLYWAIEALKDVLSNNEFTYAPTTEESRQKWREYSTPLVQFIQNHVEQGKTRKQAEREAEDNSSVTDYDYDYIRKDFLAEVIGDYCEARSHSRPSKKSITKELEKDFYVGTKSRTRQEPEDKQIPVYSGIRLQYPDPEKCAGVQTYSSTFTRTCAGARVESSQQSVHTRTDDDLNTGLGVSGERAEIVEKIEELGEGDGARVQDLVEQLPMTQDQVENIVENLKNDGLIFESSPGKVQKV